MCVCYDDMKVYYNLNQLTHTFCFACILQWADVVSSCPMCKVPFKSIIHNVRGVDTYDQVHDYKHCIMVELLQLFILA